eukprot:365129-Chlamydomonas_euryale.AAC.12
MAKSTTTSTTAVTLTRCRNRFQVQQTRLNKFHPCTARPDTTAARTAVSQTPLLHRGRPQRRAQDREKYKVEDTLMSMVYDSKRKCLVTGNLGPKTWTQTKVCSTSAGHQQPVIKVIFNDLFNEVCKNLEFTNKWSTVVRP